MRVEAVGEDDLRYGDEGGFLSEEREGTMSDLDLQPVACPRSGSLRDGAEGFYEVEGFDADPGRDAEEGEGGDDVGDGNPSGEPGGRRDHHTPVEVGTGSECEEGKTRAGYDEGGLVGGLVEGCWTGFVGEGVRVGCV